MIFNVIIPMGDTKEEITLTEFNTINIMIKKPQLKERKIHWINRSLTAWAEIDSIYVGY